MTEKKQSDLIEAACEAEEIFGLDELEEYARKNYKKCHWCGKENNKIGDFCSIVCKAEYEFWAS